MDQVKIRKIPGGVSVEKAVAFYGAGMVAVSVYYAIKELYRDWRAVCFIVSNKSGNPDNIDRIPVLSIEEFFRIDRRNNVKILVATPENHHEMIALELHKRNHRNYLLMDSRKEAALMEQYFNRKKQFISLRSYPVGTKRASLKVYMTRFHKDTLLQNPYKTQEWICDIQAGAALSEISVADIKDNTGDNISGKNGNYSELSALYWIWKNTRALDRDKEYFGLFHYRRILDLTEEDRCRMEENHIDIILPFPTIHYPSANEHHQRYVREEDWQAMTMALAELAPEYAKNMSRIFSQPYFYNYNMLIAKRKIFDDFCEWMFSILEKTESLSSPKGWERSDRYIGYLGENLTTLYFMHHKEELKIAHTGRLMLI